MLVMPRGCEREGGECSNSPTAPIAKNTTISLACSRSWRLKLLSMPLEPREVAAVIVACNEMLQMAQSCRTIRGALNIEDGLETDLERVIAKIDFGRYS
jgi:hypothetical protein